MLEELFNVTSWRGEMDWWGAGGGVATLPGGRRRGATLLCVGVHTAFGSSAGVVS